MMMTKTDHLHIRITPELKQRIKSFCEERQITCDQLLEFALNNYDQRQLDNENSQQDEDNYKFRKLIAASYKAIEILNNHCS